MAGDIITLGNKKGQKATIETVGGSTASSIVGERSSIFFNESLDGVPRRDDLFATRFLGQTSQIQLLKDIIKNQVASTDFQVRPETPEDEEASEEQVQAAESIEQFLDGNFNGNNDSFDDLLKIILDDILDFDSGVVELVSDNNGFLEQIIPRDGLTFTKNVKDTGLLPEPDSNEPAYFQFSLASHAQNLFQRDRQGIDIREITEQLTALPFTRIFSRETKEFSRDQIVWFNESPVSYQPYGIGRTQKVKQVAENMINGDMHRNRFFMDNEYHKGFLKVGGFSSQDQVKAIKEKFSESAGNEHEMNVIGVPEDAEYVSIDPEPEKMQFLESQKWYTRITMITYGANDAEAGLLENANKGISEQARMNMRRRTTEPLLNMIESKFNDQILPFFREYEQVDGKVKFEFKPEDMLMKKAETELIQDKLETGTLTVNEAREELGKEPYDGVADVPIQVLESYASSNPASAIEELTGIKVEEDESAGESPFENLNINLEEGEAGTGDDKGKSREDGAEGLRQNSDKEERNKGERETLTEISSYREAFENKDKVLSATKDALRNERGFNDVPGIVEHKDEFKNDVANVFESIDLEQELREEFPEEKQENGVLVNADEIVENLGLRDRLGSVIESNNLSALEMAAEHHEQDVEQETEERLTIPDEAKVEISFNIMDTLTADLIRQEALSAATEVEDSIKNRLKNQILKGAENGESIGQITNRITDVKQDISRDHAELVARTETLSASRKGSQALAEATDLVGGKEWLATDDSRTRAWHDAMDGTIVPKDDLFTVPSVGDDAQPSDYPRSVRVVGEDQPFNCRCSQAPVLAEDMPDSPQQLEADFGNVNVDLGVTKRQYEVWKQHGQEYDSFEEFWKNATDEMSKTEIAEKFEMSKTTVYSWSE